MLELNVAKLSQTMAFSSYEQLVLFSQGQRLFHNYNNESALKAHFSFLVYTGFGV